MASHMRSLILPAAFFLLFTAQECESADKVEEQVRVHADGSVDVAYRHGARDLQRVMDSDPTPSLNAGWDSVHVGMVREGKTDRYYLEAWNRFPPGGGLPASYASSGDPLHDWYVRFPSNLEREVKGDSVFFHYERTYPAMPWSPMSLVDSLGEYLESEETELNSLLEEKEELLEEKWETSGALEEAEEAGDSATLRLYQEEVRGLLEAGDPPFIERARGLTEGWLYFMALSDLAFTIPAAEEACREADRGASVPVKDLILNVLREPDVSPGLNWAFLMEEWNLEPDRSVFPEVPEESLDAWDEEFFADRTMEKLAQLREALLVKCGLSAEGLMEFDRQFAWLSDRYGLIDWGEIRDQRFEVSLSLPGEVVETNADTIVNGRAEWKFSVKELFEGEVRLEAVSRIIRNRP